MADHKSYMHKSFPSSKDNDKSDHLRREHNVSHEDSALRDRHEQHSVPPGDMGGMTSGHGNR